MSEQFDKIRNLIAQELDVAPAKITMDSNLITDLGADSLNVVELVMAFEEEYDVTLPDEALESIETVGDIVHAIEKMK